MAHHKNCIQKTTYYDVSRFWIQFFGYNFFELKKKLVLKKFADHCFCMVIVFALTGTLKINGSRFVIAYELVHSDSQRFKTVIFETH